MTGGGGRRRASVAGSPVFVVWAWVCLKRKPGKARRVCRPRELGAEVREARELVRDVSWV